MDWGAILTSIGIAGAGMATVAWLTKTLVTHLLQKDLETHKMQFEDTLARQILQLQHSAALELERLRAGLEISRVERELRYQRLAEQQATIIAEVFARLEAMHMAFRSLASSNPILSASGGPPEQAVKALDAYSKFLEYYHPRAIWLRRSTCNAINAILGELGAAYVDLAVDLGPDGRPKDKSQFDAAHKRVMKGVPTARAALDAEFRALLGVEVTGVTSSPEVVGST